MRDHLLTLIRENFGTLHNFSQKNNIPHSPLYKFFENGKGLNWSTLEKVITGLKLSPVEFFNAEYYPVDTFWIEGTAYKRDQSVPGLGKVLDIYARQGSSIQAVRLERRGKTFLKIF